MTEDGGGKMAVLDALAGRGSRAVAGPLAVHVCARLAGVSMEDYTGNPQVLADCVIRYWERFQPDAVWVSADTWVTAQAMGKAVAFPGPGQPLGGTPEPLVWTWADVDRIPPPDPSRQGRLPLMVEAVGRVVDKLGGQACVVACLDQYPFSLACALMGMERLMLALVDDRPLVDALLERCVEYGIAYGTALAKAGADVLSGGDSPAGLIGPRLYPEVALPAEQRLIAGLRRATSVPISLHICGNSTPILAAMARSGADVLEIDHLVDLAAACRVVPPEIALWGNLDPVQLLARGTPDEVRAAAHAALKTVDAAGRNRFVLSSGCTLAVETPEANLAALVAAAESFGPFPSESHHFDQPLSPHS